MIDTSEFAGIRLKSIGFNDGSVLKMQDNTILTLTGPNNCGKSQCLRDISSNFFSEPKKMIVVKELDMSFLGSIDPLRSCFLDEKGEQFDASKTAWFRLVGERIFDEPIELLKAAKVESPYVYRSILKFFMSYLNTSSRLISFSESVRHALIYNGSEKFSFEEVSYKEVFEDTDLEIKIHDIVGQAFGRGILLNRASFRKHVFHYVSSQDVKSRNDIGRPSYARWFEDQPLLEDQGDGIISFCNILISILTNKCPLIMIDEPEAFLHAPQIRALARIIAQQTGHRTQVIISTHSHDLVQGLIDYGSERVTVARLSRIKVGKIEKNKLQQLHSEDIADLWQDPLLRTSDVLSSLFHHVAVIVEGDSDARFFRAMLDATDSGALNSASMLNIKFFHCNGKDRIPKIAKALKAIGVPTISVVDIDILDDAGKFSHLVQSFGGDYSHFEKSVKNVIAFVSDHRLVSTSADAKEVVDEVFSTLDPKRPIPKPAVAKIHEALRTSSVWSLAKRSGEAFFTRGVPYNSFRDVVQKAKDLGIIINHHGELENLCRDVEARKADWLNVVVERDLKNDPELSDARQFTKSIRELCARLSGFSNEAPETISASSEVC